MHVLIIPLMIRPYVPFAPMVGSKDKKYIGKTGHLTLVFRYSFVIWENGAVQNHSSI